MVDFRRHAFLANWYIPTSGMGLWSSESRVVRVMRVSYQRERDSDEALVYVYFDRRTWNVGRHGLIYTCPLFLRELRRRLLASRAGELSWSRLNYTEQGMQGENFVSMIVGEW